MDAASDGPSEHAGLIRVDGSSPSVCVSAPSPVSYHHSSVVVEGQRQTTLVHQEDPPATTNGDGHAHGGPKFELRAFQEEKRPAKLFTPGEEQHVRVTRRRPTEEVRGPTR